MKKMKDRFPTSNEFAFIISARDPDGNGTNQLYLPRSYTHPMNQLLKLLRKIDTLQRVILFAHDICLPLKTDASSTNQLNLRFSCHQL